MGFPHRGKRLGEPGRFPLGLKRGQFSDQDRARYLPLRGELGSPPAKTVRRLPKEVYAMLLVVALVGSSLLAVIATIALRARGGG